MSRGLNIAGAQAQKAVDLVLGPIIIESRILSMKPILYVLVLATLAGGFKGCSDGASGNGDNTRLRRVLGEVCDFLERCPQEAFAIAYRNRGMMKAPPWHRDAGGPRISCGIVDFHDVVWARGIVRIHTSHDIDQTVDSCCAKASAIRDLHRSLGSPGIGRGIVSLVGGQPVVIPAVVSTLRVPRSRLLGALVLREFHGQL